VAKAIVNSPLVKTAVHGADPNWGRVAMAIGKCSDDTDIDQARVVIRFGDTEVYPRTLSDADLARLAVYMRGVYMRGRHMRGGTSGGPADRGTVRIHVSLATGDAEATVWGCDLTAGYVRINADYTT
jgi:glutamate N-acetyltransferase/amino-acid N-acetyltransferase